MVRLGWIVTCAMAAAAGLAVPAGAATPVPGYVEEVVARTSSAIAMDFAPDGRLFVGEKPGILKVVHPDGTVKTVLDLSSRVNSHTDRGLTGVAVDADFASNKYVYLLYTYEPTKINIAGPKTTRLGRIQVFADDEAGPETVILGTHQPNFLAEACPAPAETVDCIPADGLSHVAGTVRSAPDGTLFVGTGDAMFAATNSPDVYRPFNQSSYAGKILHVDRNGRGLPGHPFCPGDGNLTHVCTKVYAMGFRNPFRFDTATRGGLWAGDVGAATQEELDHVVAGGNYGWPCYEGTTRYATRQSSPTCTALFSKEGTAGAAKKPVFTYDTEGGAVILGGPEYRGAAYPPALRGSVFFGDIDRGFLDRLDIAADNTVTARHRFADGYGGVEMRVGPDGLLYTANFFNITRFAPASGNRPPVARAAGTMTAGPAPLAVAFSSAGTSDPDGDALTYRWDFGDGSLPSSDPDPRHTYPAGDYTATLTVTDAGGLSSTATVGIRSGVQPPTLSISGPASYRNGVPVTLAATARDASGGDLSAGVQWRIELRHNSHTHVVDDQTGARATWTPLVDHDTDSYYEAIATVTDSAGLVATKNVRADGETAPVVLEVDPPGAAGMVAYGGVSFAWPLGRRSVIGYRTTIAASPTVTSDGQTIAFATWSDGGAAAHDVTVPPEGLRLVATYRADVTPPQTTLVSPQSGYFQGNVQFRFTSEAGATFECKVDNDIWFVCVSPYTTRKLRQGQHRFTVRAIDGAGNVDPTPATWSFYTAGW